MVRKIAVLIALLFPLLHPIAAQGTRIRVIDDSDGQPVPFCHICIENRDSGKQFYHVGDRNGEAVVSLTGGEVISVTSIGYQHYLDDSGILAPDQEIRLQRSYFGLDEVVVTGQYKPVRADRSIYDIKLIGQARIQNQSASTMAELLSRELNFKINNDPSTGASLNLQGISGENVKILVDGVPVIGRLDGNIDLSQISLENVDHIEIVEGPMSVVYGSNALAGVVNIITRQNRAARFRAGLHGYYESVGIYNLNGSVESKFGNHGLSLTGGRNFFAGHDLDDSTRSMEWKPKEQYNATIDYGFRKKGTSLRNKADFFRENLLNRSDRFSYPYFENGNDTWFQTTRFTNSLHLDRKLSEANALQLLAAYSYYERRKTKYQKDLTTLESVLVTFPEEHDTSLFHSVTARGGFNHSTEEGVLDYQVGFDINTEKGIGKRMQNGEEYIGDFALFASLQWHPSGRFTFQPAIRYSYNTKFQSPVTPSLNIKYQAGKTIIRASYARGFRAPSLKELYLNFYDSNHQIEGNEELVAERSNNINLAVTGMAMVASRPLNIKAKAYYNVINDRISLVQVDPANPLYYKNANTGHFESVGGDLVIEFQPVRSLSLEAGISQIGRKDSYYEPDQFVFSTSAISNIHLKFFSNLASLSVFYKFSGKYPVYTYVSDYQIELNYLEPYHSMDLNLSVKLFRQQVTVSTGIKNLFDYTSLGGVDTGTGHGGGEGVSSLVGWGRTFFTGILYHFTKY